MLNRNIIDVLYNYDYNIMKSNSRDYLFFGKQVDSHFQTIVFMEDQSPSTDRLTLHTIQATLERTLLLKGYQNVDVLFIISTNSPFSYKELANENIPFWIIDNNAHRIISYATEDEAFTSLRNDLEERLSPLYKNPSTTISGVWKKPVFTFALALINIIVFLYMDVICAPIDQLLIQIKYSNAWEFILEDQQYYRLFTCMFLHSDIVHLFSNMVMFCALGSQLEVHYGHIKYLVTYILSGLAASGVSLAYHWYLGEPVYSLGASGAIFGIFGAYAVSALFDRAKGYPVSAVRIGFVAILMMVNGMTSTYIDNAAHLGGLVAGIIISFICCICRKNKI